MEQEIEKFKSEVIKINQRIKEFLWNAKYSIKNRSSKQTHRRPKVLGW